MQIDMQPVPQGGRARCCGRGNKRSLGWVVVACLRNCVVYFYEKSLSVYKMWT